MKQVRVGTRLTATADPSIFGRNHGYGRSEVVSVDASGNTVKVKAGEGSVKFTTHHAYHVKTTDGNWFCFAC